MLENDHRDDPAAALVDVDGPPISNGRLVKEYDRSGRETGQKLFIPTADEKKRMEERIAEELDLVQSMYKKKVWPRYKRNIRNFEALPDGEKEEMLTVPLTKKNVNHSIAFQVGRIYNKTPLLTVDPDEYGEYTVPVPTGQMDEFGEQISRPQIVTAEDIAKGGEDLMTHYLKKKLPFHRFLYDIAHSNIIGAPAWGKTCYNRVLRPQLVPHFKRRSDGMIVASGFREVERAIGSPHHLIAKSGFDVMMPDPWTDEQMCEFLFERNPITLSESRDKLSQNEWYLCTDADWNEIRKAARTDVDENDQELNDIYSRKSDRPPGFVDVYNVHFFWPAVFQDEDGEDVEGLFSFLGIFDKTTSKLLACPMQPYAHGMRELVRYGQRPKPFTADSYSTGEDLSPLQKIETRLWHSQVTNAMLANTIIAKVRPGSATWNWMKGNDIRSKSKIPVANMENDFRTDVMGRELRSLAAEIGAIENWGEQLGTSDAVRGANVPGRTSRAAINLVQEAGLTVPLMDLDFLKAPLERQLTMLYRNIGQWAMYGEEIPYEDPVRRATMMKAVQFPTEGLNGFSVRVTASSDEDAAQFEFERNVGLLKLFSEQAQAAAMIAGPMVDAKAPPVVRDFNLPIFIGHQLLLGRTVELAKLDKRKYSLSEQQIREILEKHDAWVAEQQAARAAAAAAANQQAAEPTQAGAANGNVITGDFGGIPEQPSGQPPVSATGDF